MDPDASCNPDTSGKLRAPGTGTEPTMFTVIASIRAQSNRILELSKNPAVAPGTALPTA